MPNKNEDLAILIKDTVKEALENSEQESQKNLSELKAEFEKIDLEAFATSESLDKLEKAMDEKLEEKLANLHANEPVKTTEDKFDWKTVFADEDGQPIPKGASGDTITREYIPVEVERAALPSANVAGAPVESAPLWTAMQQANFFRQISSSITVTGGSLKTPDLSGIVATVDEPAKGKTEGATLAAGDTIIIHEYSAYSEVSDSTIEDITAFDPTIIQLQMRVVLQKEHEQMIDDLNGKAAIDNVDVANADKSKLTSFTSLMAAVENQYWNNSSWVLSPQVYTGALSTQQAEDGSPVIFDPATSSFILYGYPMRITGFLEDGAANEDEIGYFGDFMLGTMIADRRSLQFQRYDAGSVVGGVGYYTSCRSGNAVYAPPLARLRSTG